MNHWLIDWFTYQWSECAAWRTPVFVVRRPVSGRRCEPLSVTSAMTQVPCDSGGVRLTTAWRCDWHSLLTISWLYLHTASSINYVVSRCSTLWACSAHGWIHEINLGANFSQFHYYSNVCHVSVPPWRKYRRTVYSELIGLKIERRRQTSEDPYFTFFPL